VTTSSEHVLPDEPASVLDALSPAEREGLSSIWLCRARAELRAAAVFARITAELVQRTSNREVQSLAARAVSDEIRHAELCRHLASFYAGADAPWPEAPPQPLPQFGDALPVFNLTLNVALTCCLSETVSAELLRQLRAEASGVRTRYVLRHLLKDEIEHARLGWAHVATLDEPTRHQLSIALPMLVRLAREAWTAPSLVPSGLPLGHGWLPDPRVASLFDEVIADVVLPGFAHLGVKTA